MSKLHFLKSLTDTINTSLIFESGEDVIVMDGGYVTETPYVYEYLKSLGGHVHTWFITHFHDDHYGCLFTLLKEHPDIRVDRLCYAFPSDEFLKGSETMQTELTTAAWLEIIPETVAACGIPVLTPRAGDTYTFDGGNLTVRVLLVPEEHPTYRDINNSSVVYRVEADGKSVMILGDLGVEGGRTLLSEVDPALIKADYCQMSHHGQNGVGREVYEAVRPAYCLWPTPSWLWDNVGEGGYDTNVFNTLVTRGWISEMHCVKRHYRMTEGTQVIDLGET